MNTDDRRPLVTFVDWETQRALSPDEARAMIDASLVEAGFPPVSEADEAAAWDWLSRKWYGGPAAEVRVGEDD